MEITNTEVWGFKHAIRGARNPLESWNKSDSIFDLSKCTANNLEFCDRKCVNYKFCLGKNDLKLMQHLILA